MDSNLAVLAIKVLDGLSARAVATAENIANAGSLNYRPLRVSFEDALRKAAETGDDAAVEQVQPELKRVEGGPMDTELRLDLETATASTTALRYSAIVEMLSRETQLQSMTITGST